MRCIGFTISANVVTIGKMISYVIIYAYAEKDSVSAVADCCRVNR